MAVSEQDMIVLRSLRQRKNLSWFTAEEMNVSWRLLKRLCDAGLLIKQ